MSLSDQLAEEIAQGKAKKLLKAIVTEIALDPELRAIIVREVASNLATKEDIKELERKIEEVRKELDAKIDELRKEINELRNQFISLTKWMIGLMASMWISIVIGIIVALMKMK